MRRLWLFLFVVAMSSGFAATADAQRFPPVMNLNTHEGKYSTGGIGFQLGGGLGLGGGLHREGPDAEIIDGNLEAVFQRRFTQTHQRVIIGGKLDFQIGSDNNVVGSNFFLEFYNHGILTGGSSELGTSNIEIAEGTDPVYTAENKSATVLYAGFSLLINFYKSEFIETDGRRTRSNWGLSLIFGPKVSMMSGDFSDLNGLSSYGFDIGLMADFPIMIEGAEDLMTISPYLMFELNLRAPVETGLVDENPASETFGREVLNDSFDLGFYNETQEDADGDGLPDYDGLAVRRHNFIPAYQFNIGAKVNFTPIFLSRTGRMINNWRFWGSLNISLPVDLGLLGQSDYPGDTMWQDNELPFATITLSIGASYFF
jgi:hypothetical protein